MVEKTLMTHNPFDIIKAEEFNHGLEQLAHLMHFRASLAGSLLSASNVFLDGSRGSGKSMYLRLLSLPAKTVYERLANRERVQPSTYPQTLSRGVHETCSHSLRAS